MNSGNVLCLFCSVFLKQLGQSVLRIQENQIVTFSHKFNFLLDEPDML